MRMHLRFCLIFIGLFWINLILAKGSLLYIPLPQHDECEVDSEVPNVCAVEEVMGTQERYYSDCMKYTTRTICEKPTFLRYQCCTGYERTDDEASTCQGVAPMENIWKKSHHLFLKEFRKHATRAKLDKQLAGEGPLTVFPPNNQGFVGIDRDTRRSLGAVEMDQSLLSYHIVGDRVYEQDLTNGMTLDSMYGDPGDPEKIYVNRYSNYIVTLNCARLVRPNQPATNGLLHVIDKVIKPIPRNQQNNPSTVMELLMDTNREFGEFVTALILAGMGNDLRSPGSFTVLAPTDKAFRSAPQEVIQRILKDNGLLKKVLKYHILEQTICSPAILGATNLTTREGQHVEVSCDVDDRLLINGIPSIHTDLVGSNGVIHTIDSLLLPNSAKSPVEIVNDLGANSYMLHMRDAGMADTLQSGGGDITFFVPSDEAFNNLTTEQQGRLTGDKAWQTKVMKYHMVTRKIETRQFTAEPALATASEDPSCKLHITVKKQRCFDVNGAHIIKSDQHAGSGVVHMIDKVLLPPEGSIADKIAAEDKLSMFNGIVQLDQSYPEPLMPEGKSYTMFAPTTEAFQTLRNSFLEKLFEDAEVRRQFLEYHVLPSPTFTSTIESLLHYRYKTKSGEWVHLARDEPGPSSAEETRVDTSDHPVVVNRHSRIISPDIHATNGVLHVIDRPLISTSLHSLANTV